MTTIHRLPAIREALEKIDSVREMEQAFRAYSQGLSVVPPVGELLFEKPPGDVHIKSGYVRGEEHYVVKIASGFPENRLRGLPSGNGLMLLFERSTGRLASILLDQGWLTEVRTAAAGAVAAKYLAAHPVRRIGIMGPGGQGRLQLEYLAKVSDCRDALAWGRDQARLDRYRSDMRKLGFRVETTLESEEIAASCDLIVTATPSRQPLLRADWIRPGTHITAMGSDTADKIELDPAILGRADRVVADSIPQSLERGEIHHGLQAGTIRREDLQEMGRVILKPEFGRAGPDEVTIADLTGVAVQDVRIASAVHQALGILEHQEAGNISPASVVNPSKPPGSSR